MTPTVVVQTTQAPQATPLRIGGMAVRQVAGTPDGRVTYLATSDGLFRSEGGGEPSRVGPAPAPGLLAVDGQRLVAGEAEGCHRGGGGSPLRYSRDGGRSWADASVSGAGLAALPRAVHGDEVLATGCGGVLRSRDSGATYARVAELSPANHDPRDLALSADGAVAYLAAVSEGGTLRVYRSERTAGGWGQGVEVDDGWGAAVLAVGPSGVYQGTAADMRVSSDRGHTWRSIQAGLTDELLSIDPTKGILNAVDQGKLRRGAGARDLAAAGDAVYAGTTGGLYVRRGDAPWRLVPGVTGPVVAVRVVGGVVYALGEVGAVRLP